MPILPQREIIPYINVYPVFAVVQIYIEILSSQGSLSVKTEHIQLRYVHPAEREYPAAIIVRRYAAIGDLKAMPASAISAYGIIPHLYGSPVIV